MRPPIVYFGGKIRLAERLIALMPEHRHYVEPYCGSLAVLLAKPPVTHETVNDLDGDLMTFWRVLRDRPADLERVCALTPHSRGEYEASRGSLDGLDDLERARRIWVQLTQSRAGLRRRAGWRYILNPAATSSSMPTYLAGYGSRIAAAAERIAAVTLECRPALDVVADFGRHPGVLLYVDPPYSPDTREPGLYLHEMTRADHEALLEALLACNSAVMLSGYASPLYDETLTGWHRTEIPTSTGQGGTWSDRTEVVWCNRPFAGQQALSLIEASR